MSRPESGISYLAGRLSPEPGFAEVREGKSRHARRAVPRTSRSRLMLEARRKAALSLRVFAEGGWPPNAEYQRCPPTRQGSTGAWTSAEFVLHSLRHTFCTRLGEAGAEVFLIQRLAGHHSVTVSERYVHPTPESAVLAFRRLDAANRRLSEVRSDTTTDTEAMALPVSHRWAGSSIGRASDS